MSPEVVAAVNALLGQSIATTAETSAQDVEADIAAMASEADAGTTTGLGPADDGDPDAESD